MKKKILLSAALLFCALSFAQTRTRNSSNTSQSSTATIAGRTGTRVSKSDVTYKNNNRKTTVYRTVPTNTKQVKTNTKTYQYNAKDGSTIPLMVVISTLKWHQIEDYAYRLYL